MGETPSESDALIRGRDIKSYRAGSYPVCGCSNDQLLVVGAYHGHPHGAIGLVVESGCRTSVFCLVSALSKYPENAQTNGRDGACGNR